MEKSLKIIRYLILGGVFLVPFLVLIVSSSLFFPFITGKNFSFRILTEILFGLWLILAIFDKNYRPKKNWVLLSVASFLFILILSTIFSVNPFRSFWSNYERMEGLLAYLHLFGLFLILTTVLKTEKLWKWFFHISLGVSVIVAFYGLLQMAGKLAVHQGGARLDATLGNSSYLAIYMVFHIFLCLLYFFRTTDWYRWFYLPVVVLETIILYHTATRGAILGFLGGLFLLGLIIAFFSKKKKINPVRSKTSLMSADLPKASWTSNGVKIFTAGFLALLIILAGSFWIFRTSNFVTQSPVLSRFSNISLSETTTQSRLVVWRMAWQGFKERPVLGWGLENFNLIFNKYYEPILYKQEPWFDRAHNVFLDQLTANGILGLLAYLSLFFCALYCLWMKRKSLGFSLYDSAILTSMFAAYFFHNLFVFDNLISLILFFSILAYIASRANLGANPVRNKTSLMSADLQKANRISNGVNSAYAIIISIAAIFLLYFINVPGLLASRALLNALQSSAQGDLPAAFQNFQKAINYNSFGSAEAREHLTNLSMQILSQPNLDNNFKQKVFDFSVSEMKKQIAQAPNDIRYMIFLASLYNKAGQYDNAIGVLNEAIELSPKKQALYFELGNSYLNKNDYDKALDVLRKAYELEPEFFEARKFYALAAIFAGKDDLAEDLMRDYGGTLYPDKSFIAAFAARKKFAQVAAIWEKILSQEPNNVQGHISLGATYLQMGEREKAIVQLQKAIELEPKFKEQGEYYIKEIRAGRNP